MSVRLLRLGRVAAVLLIAFAVGGASAEVAVRTHAAVERETRARESGSAGELISLRLMTPEGRIVAQPRLITAAGRPARLLLHAAGSPDELVLSLRVETARQEGGLIAVRYELTLPDRALRTRGSLRLLPGVRQSIPLPEGELVATLVAVPFPSAQFDDFLQTERARRAAET